jgi:hypothetical protein
MQYDKLNNPITKDLYFPASPLTPGNFCFNAIQGNGDMRYIISDMVFTLGLGI